MYSAITQTNLELIGVKQIHVKILTLYYDGVAVETHQRKRNGSWHVPTILVVDNWVAGFGDAAKDESFFPRI